jgi:hypothetical protein
VAAEVIVIGGVEVVVGEEVGEEVVVGVNNVIFKYGNVNFDEL